MIKIYTVRFTTNNAVIAKGIEPRLLRSQKTFERKPIITYECKLMTKHDYEIA